MLIELAAGELRETSAAYLFRRANPGSGATLASRRRVIVKTDGAGRPAPWSSWYREIFLELAQGELAAQQARR